MSSSSGILYTAVTNNLERRVLEHKARKTPGFTSRYKIDMLVYFDVADNMEAAISREKQIKGWTRKKKVDLINSMNREWKDLSLDWMEQYEDN